MSLTKTIYATEILYPQGPTNRKTGAISWYATGKKGLWAACWIEYRGKKVKVSYLGKSIIVTCWDTGHFRELGRVLDLDLFAFEQLAPRRQGVIRGAQIEILK